MKKRPIGYIFFHGVKTLEKEMQDMKETNKYLYKMISKDFPELINPRAFDIFLLKKKRYLELRKEIIQSTYNVNCVLAIEFHKKIGRKYEFLGSEDCNHGFSMKGFIEELQEKGLVIIKN
jgi:hypothetical protein